MHEILNPILEWLSTEHESSYRSGYGWMRGVVVVTFGGGLLETNELSSSKRSLKEEISRQLSDRCLVAKIFASGTATTAKLQKNDNSYVVTIYGSDIPEEERRWECCSIDEVENFLERETVLRLSDVTL